MQKEKAIISFLKIIGYAVLGNLMGVVMSFSFAVFIDGAAVGIVTWVIAFIMYSLVILSIGYKWAIHEKKLVKAKIIHNYNKKKWFFLSLGAGLIMCIPSVVLFVLINAGNVDFMLPFRFISGANFSAVLVLPPDKYTFAPFIYMIVYLLMPISCLAGYNLAFNEKITMENIIYKQKK